MPPRHPSGTPSPHGKSQGGYRPDSEYDSEDDEGGPTLFGSILRTVMAGAAVVAVALLVRDARRQHMK